jgi:hypothetical protein
MRRGADFKPSFVLKCFVAFSLRVHPPTSVGFAAHAAVGLRAAKRPCSPKTSLVADATNGFTHGRVISLKDKCVLFSLTRVKRVPARAGTGLTGYDELSSPPERESRRLASFACFRESRLTPTPLRREPSSRKTSQDFRLELSGEPTLQPASQGVASARTVFIFNPCQLTLPRFSQDSW